MKLIRIGMILFGMCFGFIGGAAGQTSNIENNAISGNDSLVHVVYGAGDKTVNVAYRTEEEKDVSGAISVLNPSDYLDKGYSTNTLDGVAAYVGGNNLWNMGNALVLIDGVPRSINDVTPSEIAQITFLKGANAVVLYGSRAANGVIQITTKRGKAGKRWTSVRANAGVNMPIAYPKYLGSAEYMKYYNQASVNDGLAPLYDDATISNYATQSNPYRYPDVNYYSSDYLRKLFNTYSANAQFSGGNDRARFYAEVGFQNQNSLLKIGEGNNETNNRLNVRGNIDLKINDYITTYVNVSTVFYDSRSANGNYWNEAASIQPHRFSPLIPIDLISKTSDAAQQLVANSRHIIGGKYLLGGSQQYLTNPIADAYAAGYTTFTSRQFQYTGGVNADLNKFLQGLSFHGQMSVDYSNTYNESINNTYAVYVPTWDANNDSITSLTKYNKDSNTGTQNLSDNWNDQVIDFNFHFDYVNTFKEKHNVSAMLVAAATRQRQTDNFQYGTNANLGVQMAYNYAHKYYVDFSGAVVNSTKLSTKKRVAFSPTLNLGWVLSDEGFLKGSDVINHLKLTASAGIVNTDLDIDNYYLYDAVYAPTAYFSWQDGNFTNRTTTILRGANRNLTYTKRKEVNFGIESSLFNRKLDLKATAFFIKKDGMPVLAYTQYPSYFYTSYPETSFVPYTNFEANGYHGFDFQLNFHKQLGEVNLTIGAAGTYVKTKALKRDELYEDSYRNRAGKPVDAIFGLQSEGFFADQADIDSHALQKFGEVKPGDIKYKDQNGDGVIDERDEVMIGHWGSTFTGGLNFTAQWKDLTLFVLGTTSIGGTGMKNSDYYWVYGDRKYSDVVRDSWTEENKNTATYPRLTTLSGNNNFRNSDFWTYSTDRVDLSKVQLTYSLPKSVLQNSYLKGLNIYVSGSNLLTISKNRDILQLNVGGVPQTRFYNMGIKAEF
ncbi:SusC/RagA family TonB-linked outer membrane protein [Prolixibacter bellariivorans]|uniref:SusC/RagA family TonB-linked outer membrane protein n=1 Tax=Prolixibacter bellariivorans TaxID=314319 RepID=UPI000A533848|nr:SusC/RagA family TonB-linked outer membrane protein [Prolixibacter bellariivorans]